MTLVSTSRKAAPELRALARGLAFAIQGSYIARGHTGLRELVARDETLFLFTYEPNGVRFSLYVGGEPRASFSVTAHEEQVREGPLVRGLVASPAVAGALPPGLCAGGLEDGWDLGFDGPQRLRYRLRLTPAGDDRAGP